MELHSQRQRPLRSSQNSAIPAWPNFKLDTEPDSSVSKLDSLFMEAIKPAS